MSRALVHPRCLVTYTQNTVDFFYYIMKTVYIGCNTTLDVNILQKDIEENGKPESSVLPYWKCQPYIRFVCACCCFLSSLQQ